MERDGKIRTRIHWLNWRTGFADWLGGFPDGVIFVQCGGGPFADDEGAEVAVDNML